MMRNAVRGLHKDDDGMTVVEVVVASFILFFVLTAMLGLVAATTQTSITAKQRTAMTNAVASYLDYARGLPFYAVGLRSVEPSGALDSVVTTSTGGFTTTLTVAVRPGSDDTREVQVNAACSAPGYPTMHTSAFAVIRDRTGGMVLVSAAGGPTIEFGIDTPPQDSVVFANNVEGASALYIDARAESEDGQVASMEFSSEGYRLRNGYIGSPLEAFWIIGAPSDFKSIHWDTRQVIGATTQPAIQDGWRIVRVEAVDDRGRHGSKERRFLVDNFAPTNPGPPRAMTGGWKDVTVLLNWDSATDGTEPADRYDLHTFQDLGGISWVQTASLPLTQPAHTMVTTAFSRYWASVRALSPRGLRSGRVGAAGALYSRPLLSGSATCTVNGANADVALQLDCSPPTFPTTGLRYDLYRGTSIGTLALYKAGISFPYAEAIYVGHKNSPIPYYFQVRATFTPTGPDGGTVQTLNSNAVGPTPAVGGTGSTLEQWW